MLDALILSHGDLSRADLAAIDATCGVKPSRLPTSFAGTSSPPLLLAVENPKLSDDYLSDFLSNRSNPRAITSSPRFNPLVADRLAPHFDVPRFQYSMPLGISLPHQLLLPTQPLHRSLVCLESPTAFLFLVGDDDVTLTPFATMPGCCLSGHEGKGLIGLGIIMPTTASVSGDSSSEEEAVSWHPLSTLAKKRPLGSPPVRRHVPAWAGGLAAPPPMKMTTGSTPAHLPQDGPDPALPGFVPAHAVILLSFCPIPTDSSQERDRCQPSA